jgi:hypothetical protein
MLPLWNFRMYGLHRLRDEQFRMLLRLADVYLPEMRGETSATMIFAGIFPPPPDTQRLILNPGRMPLIAWLSGRSPGN